MKVHRFIFNPKYCKLTIKNKGYQNVIHFDNQQPE